MERLAASGRAQEAFCSVAVGCHWLLPISRTLGFRFAILGKRDQGFQALGLHYSSEHMASKF